jgi:hypothetical protein
VATCPGGLIVHADGTIAGCTEDDNAEGGRGRDLCHEGDPTACSRLVRRLQLLRGASLMPNRRGGRHRGTTKPKRCVVSGQSGEKYSVRFLAVSGTSNRTAPDKVAPLSSPPSGTEPPNLNAPP